MRILVVDDSEDSLDLTEGMLLSAGYSDVVTATSAWEALKILDVGSTSSEVPAFDVVLLDIVMPEMDGIEACARIRNDRRCTDLPIIMVTALSDMDSLANAFVAGATDYITKPVNRIELVARVRAALRLKQERDRRQARERELLAFLSSWGDRRAGMSVDETVGLIAGEVAESYLNAARGHDADDKISVFTLTLDRFDAYRAVNGEEAAAKVMAQVARAVRRLPATVGTVAASYPNGMMILVAPDHDGSSARKLAEALRATVQKLRVPNSESSVSEHVTASVAAITGPAVGNVNRIQLLIKAISAVQQAATAGGNRVVTAFDDGTAPNAGGPMSNDRLRKRTRGAAA